MVGKIRIFGAGFLAAGLVLCVSCCAASAAVPGRPQTGAVIRGASFMPFQFEEDMQHITTVLGSLFLNLFTDDPAKTVPEQSQKPDSQAETTPSLDWKEESPGMFDIGGWLERPIGDEKQTGPDTPFEWHINTDTDPCYPDPAPEQEVPPKPLPDVPLSACTGSSAGTSC